MLDFMFPAGVTLFFVDPVLLLLLLLPAHIYNRNSAFASLHLLLSELIFSLFPLKTFLPKETIKIGLIAQIKVCVAGRLHVCRFGRQSCRVSGDVNQKLCSVCRSYRSSVRRSNPPLLL